MLTVDYDRLGAASPATACSTWAAAAAATRSRRFRRGARVVAFDYAAAELKDVGGLVRAPCTRPARRRRAAAAAVGATATAPRLPFPDDTFDRIIAREVLEHIPDDDAARSPSSLRVLKPGGTLAVTVPSGCPSRSAGRCPTSTTPRSSRAATSASTPRPSCGRRMRGAGLEPGGAHHAHALHSPYWWLKCAVGPTNDDHPLVQGLPPAPGVGHRPGQPIAVTRWTEQALNPVLGKSLVVYATQAGTVGDAAAEASACRADVAGPRHRGPSSQATVDAHRRVAAARRA